jgi:prepilin-type N-terminal cleavage/methylation domain-containing protein
MTRRGFTIVELIITITIMGILLTLAVVNLSATQVGARDNERKADIEAIASNLEAFYTGGRDDTIDFSRYPSTGIVGTETSIKTSLRDANLKSFLPPGATSVNLTFLASTNTGTAPSIQTEVGVQPQPTKDTYIYQPIKSDGAVCTPGNVDCRKFNLFYKLEADNTVYRITSKNQ